MLKRSFTNEENIADYIGAFHDGLPYDWMHGYGFRFILHRFNDFIFHCGFQ